MDRVKRMVTTLEHLLSTKGKRHIIGGILLSASVFFGGLALTVMSAKIEEKEDNENQND